MRSNIVFNLKYKPCSRPVQTVVDDVFSFFLNDGISLTVLLIKLVIWVLVRTLIIKIYDMRLV